MAENVEISVKGGLRGILAELEKINKKSKEVEESLRDMSKETEKSVDNAGKKTESNFVKMQNLARRTADQMKRDFKTLLGLESLGAGLKLSNQFKNSISETVALSDAVRKLGATFGIPQARFADFAQQMTQGLGEIGLSSESAVNSLTGLAKTNVRSPQGLVEYAKKAGMLASIGREPGKEGDIAKSLASVIRARGGNPENLKELGDLSESIRRVTIQTGDSPSAVLGRMEDLFSSMPEDLRKSISSKGLTNLAAAQFAGGPNATKFLEEILGKSPIARQAFEAQGGKGVFTDQGIDTDKFGQFARSIMGRIGNDPRLAAQTLGLSEDAAEGFVRLAESLDKVKEAQDKIQKSTGSLMESYQNSMGLGEAFRANINKVKGNLSGFLEGILQFGTDTLSKSSQSDIGSGAIVAGGGVLAAVLAGMGARGALGSLAKGAAATQLTGKDVQPVYVVNAAEISAGGLGAGPGGGGLATAAKVLGVGALAYGVGSAGQSLFENNRESYNANSELKAVEAVGGGYAGMLYEAFYNALVKANNAVRGTDYQPLQREKNETTVKIEMTTPLLKATVAPSTGATSGPAR